MATSGPATPGEALRDQRPVGGQTDRQAETASTWIFTMQFFQLLCMSETFITDVGEMRTVDLTPEVKLQVTAGRGARCLTCVRAEGYWLT